MAYGALSDELLQWALGKENQALSHDEHTARTIEELRLVAEQAEQRSDLARLSGALRDLAAALNDAGELTSAAEMLQKAAGLQLGRGQHLDYAFTLVLLGQVLLNQERFDEAMAEFQRALTVFLALDFRPGESFALGAMATVFHRDKLNAPDTANDLYQSSIEADPENANILGDYANFILHEQKNFDKSEALYKRAIEVDLKHADNLGNYALFLSNTRKDFDRAEELYKRAIEAAPKHVLALGAYANFLSNDRKDFDKAEELYKRALEGAPKHANILGNYAGMLLAIGRKTDGLSLLDRAIDAPGSPPAQRTECWFYALAHRAPEQRSEALAQLKRLIVTKGARSPGWDLSAHVERAQSDGHPDAAWLALLADVISEKAESAVLEAWPAWVAA